ncbi:MAG: flagellar biosynthesis anti-sigma factor FlgM, partial [Desulfobulbaceae bacterium]|nr:flagellar biosynthesis anti-sigma factor FlgM [Desulfobulbaceae bacterium]
KERIDQDEYQIDPYKVADKMMMSLLSETVFE